MTRLVPQAVLVVGGSSFHLVNTGLALLRMLREYVAFQDDVPAFASDTARRVVALLQARAAPALCCSVATNGLVAHLARSTVLALCG